MLCWKNDKGSGNYVKWSFTGQFKTSNLMGGGEIYEDGAPYPDNVDPNLKRKPILFSEIFSTPFPLPSASLRAGLKDYTNNSFLLYWRPLFAKTWGSGEIIIDPYTESVNILNDFKTLFPKLTVVNNTNEAEDIWIKTTKEELFGKKDIKKILHNGYYYVNTSPIMRVKKELINDTGLNIFIESIESSNKTFKDFIGIYNRQVKELNIEGNLPDVFEN